jgi:hypothetical protein
MSTRDEFAGMIGYLTIAIGVPIAGGAGETGERERKARMNAYYDLLGHLPAAVLLAAAKKVAGAHKWTTFPQAAELRTAAEGILDPQPTVGEAWRIVQISSRKLADENLTFHNGIPTAQWNRQIMDAMPEIVAITFRLLGGRRLVDSTTAYAQFRDEYERQIDKHRDAFMECPTLKALRARIGHEREAKLPAPANSQIRLMPIDGRIIA